MRTSPRVTRTHPPLALPRFLRLGWWRRLLACGWESARVEHHRYRLYR